METATVPATAIQGRTAVRSSATALPAWAVAVLAALLVVLYLRVCGKLLLDWYVTPDYAHGFLIPFFCVWVVW